LSVEAIMPTITREWDRFNKIKNEIDGRSANENRRWVILVFIFSVLIGIKVSNSSRELFGGRTSSIYRKSFMSVMKYIHKKTSNLIGSIRSAFNKVLQR
jgi:hypothetical protein